MPNFDNSEDKKRHRYPQWPIAALLAGLFWTLPLQAAGVQVFDQVTAVNQAVFLKIRTGGQIFPSGGQRVQLQLPGQEPQSLLSGADGFAYHRFQPREPGLMRITAASGSERDHGFLLVLANAQPALLLEIDPALRTGPFSGSAREDSREAVERLQSHYGIVYLTRWLWTDHLRDWLTRAGFAESAVIRWQGRTTARQLDRHGVEIAVAIGSSRLMQELPDTVKHRYSFDPKDGKPPADRWREILQALEPEDE